MQTSGLPMSREACCPAGGNFFRDMLEHINRIYARPKPTSNLCVARCFQSNRRFRVEVLKLIPPGRVDIQITHPILFLAIGEKLPRLFFSFFFFFFNNLKPHSLVEPHSLITLQPAPKNMCGLHLGMCCAQARRWPSAEAALGSILWVYD